MFEGRFGFSCFPDQRFLPCADGRSQGAQAEPNDHAKHCAGEDGYQNDQWDRYLLELRCARRIEKYKGSDNECTDTRSRERAMCRRFNIENEKCKGCDQEEDTKPIDRQHTQPVGCQ